MSKTIELSDAEYRTLTRLVFYGEWILNSTEVDPAEMDQEVKDLQQKIYSKKEAFNASDFV